MLKNRDQKEFLKPLHKVKYPNADTKDIGQ